MDEVNLPRALEIEAEIHHDLMAEVRTFAEQAPVGGGIIHLGATSMDIEDNADVLRVRQSLDLVLDGLRGLLLAFVEKIEAYADTPLMAFTHLQPAEPSTLGYRLAATPRTCWWIGRTLRRARRHLRGKGFKGAVGTGASYAELLGVERVAEFEAAPFDAPRPAVLPGRHPGLPAQAGLRRDQRAGRAGRIAVQVRLRPAPAAVAAGGRAERAVRRKQVGSSAMPFKRNPINAEKIDSLARALAQMPRVAWDNAAHSLLERTLDDSANRRTLLPEAFLTADELLRTATKIVDGLRVDERAMAQTGRLRPVCGQRAGADGAGESWR